MRFSLLLSLQDSLSLAAQQISIKKLKKKIPDISFEEDEKIQRNYEEAHHRIERNGMK